MNSFIIKQCPPLYIDRSARRVSIRPDMISVLFLAWILNFGNAFNEFPSLMSANASMAVVIDKSFFDKKHEYIDVTKRIHEYITNIAREEMHMGDINVRVFRNAKINNLRGKNNAPGRPLNIVTPFTVTQHHPYHHRRLSHLYVVYLEYIQNIACQLM
ncbi:uncharacterized protein LOC112589406 [Harpegnathos saltator]|uniref:uncharacterized protein LOC112589406 n=1 Tax=Harpegnathos saltator TaxID=610380 RepID=UPI000DBEF224|nr:uncharacterized protein LOC112589406 [Harpegnathos saltator]